MEEVFERIVLQKKFRSSAVGGYHKEDVDKTIFELCNAMSDLRQNHAFLLDQVKKYQEKEQAIATAILSAQTTANEIIEAARAEAKTIEDRAAAVLREADEKAQALIGQAKEMADELEADGDVALMSAEAKAKTIVSEAEKLAAEIVAEANAEAERRQEEAERSISFASAYQIALGEMNGEVNRLLARHIVLFLKDLTATVKAEAAQRISGC